MIKVLQVITDSNIGGAGHWLYTCMDGYNRADFHMEVVLPTGSLLIPGLRARGVAYTEVASMADRSFSWRGVWDIRRVCAAKKPDIVHTHAALSGRVAARLCGCKIVHTRHSVFTQAPNRLRWLAGFVINNALSDAMIAVSPAARDDLRRVGASDAKIHVIYNGVPPSAPRSPVEKKALRRAYGVPENAFVVAVLARLADVKGHDYVLDAVKALAGEGVVALFAGDGPRRAHLEQRMAEEQIPNVRLLGFVDAVDEVENIMDVQVNASFGTEATSLSLLRGMRLGVPAIASAYGGNPYVIEPEVNGLLVPERDADALRAAILRMKNEEGLHRRLSDGALRRFTERFTAREMMEKTEALYKQLLSTR